METDWVSKIEMLWPASAAALRLEAVPTPHSQYLHRTVLNTGSHGISWQLVGVELDVRARGKQWCGLGKVPDSTP